MAQSARQTCEICMSARGSEYCLDCSQYFCTGCKISHLRIAVCKTHSFKDANSASSNASIFCQEHNDAYVFICETCEQPVCKICIVKTHKGHSLSDVEETVSMKKHRFQISLNSMLNTDAVQQLELIETQIKEQDSRLHEEVRTAIEGIRLDGEVLKKSVDSAVQQMIKDVQDKEAKENARLNRTMTETNKCKEFRDSLKAKELTIRTRRSDIGLLHEITELEKSFQQIQLPSAPTTASIKYTNMKGDVADDKIKQLLGQVTFASKDNNFVSIESVLKGEVFERFLRHGTTFRNEISMLQNKVKTLSNTDDETRLILFYQAQTMNEVSHMFVPKTVKVFIELNGDWNKVVLRSIDQLSTAAPGLLFQTCTDSKCAELLIIGNSADNIQISWEQTSNYHFAIIEIGKEFKIANDQKQAVMTIEILFALGFHREMLRLYSTLAEAPFKYENEEDVVRRFDPYSILLLGTNKTPVDGVVWKFEISTTSEDIQTLSELDKVGLNLLFPPCPTESYQPKLSIKSKMLYCGRRVMQNHNRPSMSLTDGRCGPTNGANCPACRTLIEPKVGKMKQVVLKGKFQGWSGQIYCNKKGSGLSCGPNHGSPCRACRSELSY